MKIKYIKLHPFAGIQEKEIEFSDGLNLLLGPNEAGKSTIFHAISHGLLTTTNLTSREFDDGMRPYLPVGGDVIRVTLEIYEDDPESFFEIQKTWKPGLRNGEAKMIIPDGTEIVDEDTIQDTIENLLPTTPSTMREVLLSRQSELHQVMDKMEGQEEVQQELSGILRQNVMEAGGISVDKFQQKVSEAYDKYFGRWDRDKQYPILDNGSDRGIQYPWKQGVGEVLKAWYKKEKAKKRFEDVVEYEQKLDELNRQLERIESDLTKKEQKQEAWAPIEDELSQREVLKSKLEAIEGQFDRIKKISTKWPIYENEIAQKEPELKKLDEKLEALTEEQEKAVKKAEIQTLEQRLQKLDSIKGDVKEAEKDLKKAKEITEEDVKALRGLKNKISELEMTIQASRLKLQLTARQDTEITLRDVNGEVQTKRLGEGDEITEEQEGLISIETDQIKATVTSATGDLDEVVTELNQNKEELKNKLDELGVKDPQEASTQHELYKNYKQQLTQSESRYQDVLGDDNYEDLKEKLESAGNMDKVRDLNEIQTERDDVQDQRNELRNEINNKQEQLDEWREEFDGEIDNVFQERAELTNKRQEINNKLEDLPEVPDQFESFDEFRTLLSEIEQSVDRLKEQRSTIREERAEMMGGAPDKTSNELQEQYQELEVTVRPRV